jgi:putative transposase
LKKPYQIEKQRAVLRLEKQAAENQQPVQLSFPLKDLVEQLQQGLMSLVRRVGIQVLEEFMAAEVKQITQKRGPAGRLDNYRWGRQRGYCILAGQKVPLRRPRVRNRKHSEIALGSYELIQRGSLLEESIWQKMIHGLTTRRYSEVVREFSEAYGIEKSTVSDHFVQASRAKLHQLLTRRLEELPLCAMLIDGTWFQKQEMIVALGVALDGSKHVLGLCQGASENTTVVKHLLENLQQRGLNFQIPRLYVLDGSKSLVAAVRRLAGEAALIQRCQIHKLRNVGDHLIEQHRFAVQHQMKAAYATLDYADAKRALHRLLRQLMDLNPTAAHSLEEGLEETLTLHRLRLPGRLRHSLASTNLIESGFSIVDTVCRNVKTWKGGDHRLRWVASALIYAESRWYRLQGYRQIPILIKEMEVALLRKVVPARHAGVA